MTHRDSTALLSAALSAAEHGWPVIPLHPGEKVPALHGKRRCPGTGDCAGGHRTFEQRATTDPDRIERCWAAGPYNVGIATGPAGLLVVDLDTLKPTDEKGTPDGVSNFLALCERAGQPVPTTRRIRTARGGEHLYFTVPAGPPTAQHRRERSRRRSTPARGADRSSPPAASRRRPVHGPGRLPGC